MADYRGMTAVTCLDGATRSTKPELVRPAGLGLRRRRAGRAPGLVAAARLRIKIPMPGAVESLNVAAAAAVCLFETLRRRQAE
jgi:TrmH family RNA methyltransferase